MEKLLRIALMLTASDRMSRVISDAVQRGKRSIDDLKKSSESAFNKGLGFTGAGAAVIASLAPAVTAFADLEDSSTRLKVAMMGPGGVVSSQFPKLNDLAEQLGDKLPGTTSDFHDLFEVMLNSGVQAETILNGVGRSAAYLAVNIGMPYAEAGRFAARMKEATGVADEQMLEFMDTISRVRNLGVEAGEMQFAFGRSAGALKLLGLQGIEASKSVANVYAQIIRAGLSGETVGTGFAGILTGLLDADKMSKMNQEAAKLGITLQFFKNGKFLGIENLVGQLDKLRGFTAEQRAGVINALTGGGQDAQMLQTLISNGIEGFNKMNRQMAAQATLEQKVTEQTQTMKSLWEATTGTITNMWATIGKGLEDTLKPLIEALGKAAGAVKDFFQANPLLAKFLALTVAAIGVFLAVVGVINIVKAAFIALRVVMMANPFILIATIAIMAVTAIITYWDKIRAFFVGLWNNIKNIFLGFIKWLFGLGDRFFQAGKNIINNIWEGIKALISKPIEAVKNMVTKIREYLPFSPAKVGPLKDIHKIKLVETIAEAIKPEAAINAIRRTAQSIATTFFPGAVAQPSAVAGGAGGPVSVNFAPVVNVAGAAGASIIEELKRYEPQLLQLIDSALARRERRKI